MKSAICRAKDPTQCPYHGAVIRMYDAVRNEDFNGFADAREAVKRLEEDGRTEEELLSSINVALAGGSSGSTPAPAPVLLETSLQYLERVIGDFDALTPGTATPDYFLADDQMGEKLLFAKNDASERPSMPPSFVRIELDRPLDQSMASEEHEKLAGLLGFMNKAIIHSKEPVGHWWVDTDNSLVARIEFSNSSNYVRAMDMFSDQLEAYVEDGSPSRTDGSQLISGLKDEPQASLWYGYDPHAVADEELDFVERVAKEKGL